MDALQPARSPPMAHEQSRFASTTPSLGGLWCSDFFWRCRFTPRTRSFATIGAPRSGSAPNPPYASSARSPHPVGRVSAAQPADPDTTNPLRLHPTHRADFLPLSASPPLSSSDLFRGPMGQRGGCRWQARWSQQAADTVAQWIPGPCPRMTNQGALTSHGIAPGVRIPTAVIPGLRARDPLFNTR